MTLSPSSVRPSIPWLRILKIDSRTRAEVDLWPLDPGAGCSAAISFARVRARYFGGGGKRRVAAENGPPFFADGPCHPAPEVYSGIGGEGAKGLLKDFFSTRR